MAGTGPRTSDVRGQDSQSCPKPKMDLKYCFLTVGFVFQQYIGHILSLEGFMNPAPGLKSNALTTPLCGVVNITVWCTSMCCAVQGSFDLLVLDESLSVTT